MQRGSIPLYLQLELNIMYVDVIFRNGTKGRILKAEYEANKDKGYINCLAFEHVEKQAKIPMVNKMVTPKNENKGRKRRG